jgi:hypothetical protein
VRLTVSQVPTDQLGPLVDNRYSAIPSQLFDRLSQKRAPPAARVQEDPSALGPVISQDQARDTPSTAEVESQLRNGVTERLSEPQGVLAVTLQ